MPLSIRRSRMVTFSCVVVLAALIWAALSGGPSPVASASTGASPLKAVMIEIQKPGDRATVDLHLAGIRKAAKEFGFSSTDRYVEDPADYEQTIRRFAQAGYNLIFTTFPPMTRPTINVAKEFPNVYFANTVGEVLPVSQIPKNMVMLDAKHAEGSFLAGALAAYMSKSGKIAFMCGPMNDVNLRVESGVWQGAVYVNKTIKLVEAVTKSYQDPANGKEVALRLFKSGVDVITTAAAGSDLGIHAAAETTPSTWHTITLDSPRIIDVAPKAGYASISLAYQNWTYRTMRDVAKKTFKGGRYISYGLKEGGWNIAQWNNKTVPPTIRSKILNLEKAINSGKIKPVWRFPADKALAATLKKRHAP